MPGLCYVCHIIYYDLVVLNIFEPGQQYNTVSRTTLVILARYIHKHKRRSKEDRDRMAILYFLIETILHNTTAKRLQIYNCRQRYNNIIVVYTNVISYIMRRGPSDLVGNARAKNRHQ